VGLEAEGRKENKSRIYRGRKGMGEMRNL